MARAQNPYRPGFNQAPGVLAGRDDVLAAVREALQVAAQDGRTPRPVVLVGSRGVGKTVLLGECAVLAAAELGWLTVSVEVRPGMSLVSDLCGRLDVATQMLDDPTRPSRFEVDALTARVGAFGVGGEVSVRRRERTMPDVDLESSFSSALASAERTGSGLMVTVDELQLAHRGDLADLAATLQQHVPENWPLVVVLAGLPTIRDSGRSVTYLERSEWHEIGLLNAADSRVALVGPAEAAGRPMTDSAADLLVDASGGYPYALQVLGHHSWRTSSGSETIEASHVRAAVPLAEQDMSSGLYAGRWNDASPREREYLAAVAELDAEDDDVTGGMVAARLGRAPKELSYVRDRLLKKGSLVAEGRRLRFPVPGMSGWIRAHQN